MRFNKQELIALASQTSLNFDREGVLFVKEKQEGFFRRSEISIKRWFRLRGNLLFYLRGPEQCSEPMGVIVLEQCTVQTQSQDELGHWPFQIVWDGIVVYKLAAYVKSERTAWLNAIKLASYEHVKSQIIALQEKLERIRPALDMDISTWRELKGLVMDINEVPLCELALSCDNLLCDAHGKPPSPMIVVHVKYPNGQLIRYASTEVVETSSNPSFSRTIIFRASDGLTGDSLIRISVYNMREQLSQTAIPMGYANILLSTIQDTQRLRITLSTHNKDVGFVTLNGWSLEPSYIGASPKHSNGPNSMDIPQKALSHRRSHSLPPRLGMKLKLPSHGNAFKQNFANAFQITYRFHSGLGGDITVHEIMAESKLCFQMPINLLGLYIQREKELLQEVLCMGELGGQWKFRQMELLDTHLSLLKHYSHARQSMQTFLQTSTGKFFKQSSRKDDSSLEFAPVNLHLQRMWAHNDTLNKSGFHDIITVGAFAAHTHKAGKPGGLIRLVQEMKDINNIKSTLNSPSASRVQMACDAVQAIKQLRGEIVDIMAKLLALSKVKQSTGMMQLAEDMIVRTRTLLTLWDPGLVEEALSFIDRHKVSQPVASMLPGLTIKDRPHHLSPFTQLTDQLSKLDLRSPELEDFATPCTPKVNKMVWPLCDSAKLSSSVPNVCCVESSNANDAVKYTNTGNIDIKKRIQPTKELHFHNDHFDKEAEVYANLERFQSLNFHKKSNDFTQSSPIDQPFNYNLVKSCSQSPESDVYVKTNEQKNLGKNASSFDQEYNGEKVLDPSNSLVFQMSFEENDIVDYELNETKKSKNEMDRDSIDSVASNDPIAKQYLDVTTMTNSPSANYYQPSDEPEPWDLTQLNIEASVMCLVSKVKFLCGRCGSPAIRLRHQKSVQAISVAKEQSRQSTEFDQSELTSYNNMKSSVDAKHSTYMSAAVDTDSALVVAVDTLQKVVKKGNKFTDGLKLSEVYEWSDELRPPMRKLRQAMDGLLKSGRLAHAVLRLRCESVQRTRAHAALQVRRDACFSQALTTVTTGLLCWLWTAPENVIVSLLEAGLGPLCGFEGLLSLYRSEKAMWGDMVVAIEDLQTVLFTLTKSNHGSNTVPQVTGSRSAFNVLIPVPDSLYAKFSLKQHLSFTITAVFFNVGINEKATLAEALRETLPQEQSNTDNFDRLNKYYHKYKKIFPADHTNISRASTRVKPLDEVMENLRIAVHKKVSKNVEVLQMAALATRHMNGVRITSCKSAKDRTGMSATLEQCTILANEYHLADHEFEKALDCFRSEGCRRENTLKNISVRKYAFNKLQILALPKKYRPPRGSYGSTQT